MSISTSNAISGPYETNGVTADFPFDFTAASADEVTVMLVDESMVASTAPKSQFDVSLTPSGGTVSFEDPVADGYSLYVLSDVAFTSDISLQQGSPFLASSIQAINDRSVLRDQLLSRRIDSSVQFPSYEAGFSFPSAPARASKLFGFGAGGAAELLSYSNLASALAAFLPENLKGDPGSPGEGYSTRDALSAALNDATNLDDFYLTEDGREGKFIFDDGDLSDEVASDPLQGLYIAPASDPTGASGAAVRQWKGQGYAEWFGAKTDYDADTLTGTDNSPAIQACLTLCGNCCLLVGLYGIGSSVFLGQGKHLYAAGGVSSAALRPLATFADTEMVDMSSTRSFISRVALATGAFFDPQTYTGTGDYIDGIVSVGDFYHQHVRDCRVVGTRRAFYPRSKEMKLFRCHGQDNYDDFYIDGFDTSLFNCSSTNAVNDGLATFKGVEVRDLHVVRAGNRSFFAFNQIPIMVDGLFIDTPTKVGISLQQVRGPIFGSVYFTKAGEFRTFDGGTSVGSGTTPDHDVYYFTLINVRNATFTGGAINVQNNAADIDQNGIYLFNFGDSADDTLRSINNRFINFRSSTVAIAKNAGQRASVVRQQFVNCSGTLSRINNDSLLHRSDKQVIGAAGVYQCKVWLNEINTTAAARRAVVRGEYVAVETATPANFSEGRLRVAIAPSANAGSVTVDFDGGTPPTFTVSNIALNTATRVLTFDVTNTGAAQVDFALTLNPALDNQGLV